jgi:hypothetical protein
MGNHKPNESCEQLELYVLGGLSESEKTSFEQHLNECDRCEAQRRELEEMVGLLPLAADPVPVPTGMKSRILGNVLASGDNSGARDALTEPEAKQEFEIANKTNRIDERPFSVPVGKRKKRPYSRYLAAGLSAAVLVLLLHNSQLRDRIDELRLQADVSPGVPIQELKVNQAIKLSPAAENIVAQGLATIVIDKNGTHLLVQAEQLPELQDNQAFQVWLIKGDDKFSAGTFLPNQGNGAIYYTLRDKGYDTIAITLEPDAFGDQPRGEIVLAAPLDA